MGRGRKKKTSIDYESDQYNFIQELHNDGIDIDIIKNAKCLNRKATYFLNNNDPTNESYTDYEELYQSTLHHAKKYDKLRKIKLKIRKS